MNLQIDTTLGTDYKSPSQIVRVRTEAWTQENFYCPICPQGVIRSFRPNNPAIDFECTGCSSVYQLKSLKKLKSIILDGEYNTMLRHIKGDNVPNLVLLNYSENWMVSNLLMIPSFFVTESCVIKRNPLSSTAVRAGYIGCNINISNVSESGKLWFVRNGIIRKNGDVKQSFLKISNLRNVKVDNRGWTLAVLKLVESLNSDRFTLNQVYAFEPTLKQMFPNNNTIRDKIRQQLQILRDQGLLRFDGKGEYSLCR